MKLRSPFAILIVVMLLLSSCGGQPAAPAASQPTEAVAVAEPTTAPAAPEAAEPTTAPAAAEPTTAPEAAEPTTAPEATEPTTAPAAEQPADSTGVAASQDPLEGPFEPIQDGLFPLSPEKTTLTVLTSSNGSVEDFNTNEFTKWYEDKTNVHVEWQTVQEADTQVNLAVASGELPDIILGAGLPLGQQAIYGEQGVFLALNDLIEKYGIETKRVFNLYPKAKEAATTPSGNIYGLPEVNDCYHCTMSHKMWIYQPWLDKLGLKMPTTTEEFAAVLKAFKEGDPNGNGTADEQGIVQSKDDTWHSGWDNFLMNAFLISPGDSDRVLKDGKIQVTFDKPEWQDGLRYMHSLYKDGLISPDSFTQDTAALRRAAQNPDMIVGAYQGGAANSIVSASDKRFAEYVAVPPLKGPKGVQVTPYQGVYPFGLGKCIVTKAAKDPALAFRWCDAQYNETVQLYAYWGREGKEWRYAEEGEIGINGKPATHAALIQWGDVNNNSWMQTALSFRSDYWRTSQKRLSDVDLEVHLYEQTKLYEPYKQPLDTIVPPLYFSNEEATELGNIEAPITQYVDEMLARFIVGDADIDKEWDTYIQTLEQMGLPRYIELYQGAYDAKYKK